MNFNGPFNTETVTESDAESGKLSPRIEKHRRRGRLAALGVVVFLCAALVSGAWNHLTQYRQAEAAARQERDLVPQVRVAAVQPSADIDVVKLPATTSAFASANIYARASGYIRKRVVDIGDRVKTGQLLAEIVAETSGIEAALARINEALVDADKVEYRWDLAFIHRQRGNLLVREAVAEGGHEHRTAAECLVRGAFDDDLRHIGRARIVDRAAA